MSLRAAAAAAAPSYPLSQLVSSGPTMPVDAVLVIQLGSKTEQEKEKYVLPLLIACCAFRI